MKAIAVILLALIAGYEAHVYTRCELAQTLVYTYGWPQADMGTWVCICEHESSLNTAAIGPPNSDGSQDYGLFQINSRYWCSGGPQSQYNECGVDCYALTDDDISNDCSCAWLIYSENGFGAWSTYNNYCQYEDVSQYVAGCF